jgi:hypothetical protein
MQCKATRYPLNAGGTAEIPASHDYWERAAPELFAHWSISGVDGKLMDIEVERCAGKWFRLVMCNKRDLGNRMKPISDTVFPPFSCIMLTLFARGSLCCIRRAKD